MSIFYRNAHRHTLDLHGGFTHIPAADVVVPPGAEAEFESLCDCFHNLVPDNPGRHRAFLQTILMPQSSTIDLSHGSPNVIGSDYWQSNEHNAEAGGSVRHFAPLSPFARANRILQGLVMADVRLSCIDRLYPATARLPVVIGIHMIRLFATPDRPAVALPNRPHKDGELFTFIHLVARHGVTGGESEFYDNGPDRTTGPLRFRAPLQTPMETFGVCDVAGYHHVLEVRTAPGYMLGWRDVLLIDVTPLVPVLMAVDGSPRALVTPLQVVNRPEVLAV